MFFMANAVQAEEATREKIGMLRAFWENLRDNYQDDLMLFGKIVLLSLAVIVGAWLVSRLITAAITVPATAITMARPMRMMLVLGRVTPK